MTIGVYGKAGGDFTLTPVIQEFYSDPAMPGTDLRSVPIIQKENWK